MLNHKFEGWYAATHSNDPNRHGIYNGINLAGLDIAKLYLQLQENPSLTIPQFISHEEVYFKVALPRSRHFELPLVPFDGGRAMAAMAPAMWFVGLGLMVVLLLASGNPFLLIFVVLGAMETWRRWKLRGTRSLEQAAYYRVSPRHRLIVGATYLVLIALLVLGMHEAHILASGSHSFRSL